MSASTRDLLRGAWRQLGRVTIVPEPDTASGGPAPWAGALVVATGVVVGAVAWLGARALVGLGAAPALAALVAVALAIAGGAGLIERGAQVALERWTGARWAPLVVAGAVLARLVALWSMAPRLWLGALVVALAAGRWAAVGLQRLGDVAPASRGRTLIVARPGGPELAAATIVVVTLALLVAGGAGLLVLVIGAVAAGGLGVAVQLADRELASDSLAAIAAAVELIVLIGLASAAPALGSPFVR